MNSEERIYQLTIRLNALSKQHELYSKEISSIRTEINLLKERFGNEELKDDYGLTNEFKEPVHSFEEVKPKPLHSALEDPKNVGIKPKFIAKKTSLPKVNMELEKFIGENLINKIGIIITIIGVAIGAKYSIEHELVSPLTRIILGYVAGIALLGFGIKLKAKYESYSAVLVSGAIAIMYFITYSAHTFYGLIPQLFAFALMVLFTAFTVVAAVNYNRQIIAHIGLVGAYAIPFLLSNNSGNVLVLFAYMAIINVGILIISFKKYWKQLYYNSFGLTWIIYCSWFVTNFSLGEHFVLALAFGIIFFATFYVTFLAYKLIRKEEFKKADIVLLILNSFVFYGMGYVILDNHETGKELLGLFTLANGIVHFIVSTIIYRLKLGDKNLFYLVVGLVLVFITIAIPVQLDGNWVTLMWVGEAALLFWIGRTKKVSVYEKLAYPLMLLAFFSIIQDWSQTYGHYYPVGLDSRLTPILNVHFLSSLLFVAAFGFINFINQNKKFESALIANRFLYGLVSYALPIILIFGLYNSLRLEISNYWSQMFLDSELQINTEGLEMSSQYSNLDLLSFKTIWVANFSLLFFSILAFVNIAKFKIQKLGLANLAISALILLFFLIQGLMALSELRESYLEQTFAKYYERGMFNLVIRYISFGFVGLLLLSCYRYVRQSILIRQLKVPFDIMLHISILWIASSELINWMDIAGSEQSYKLGLSILWGVYALLAIALGIWKRKKHLRIGAFILFGITLLKLFFYDISHLNTISKTIVFVSLGVLLLIISFLYNKYKQYITDENEI